MTTLWRDTTAPYLMARCVAFSTRFTKEPKLCPLYSKGFSACFLCKQPVIGLYSLTGQQKAPVAASMLCQVQGAKQLTLQLQM